MVKFVLLLLLFITGDAEAQTSGTADKDVKSDTREFKAVDIPAAFPGGDTAWINFLRRTINNNVVADSGAPAGKYTVMVSFSVDKEGNVTNVRAENNPGYGSAQEAVRVIMASPKWRPASQNGRNVIFRQRQALTFVVSDDE